MADPFVFVICRGLPGSGKSTWALEQLAAVEPGQAVRVNRDLIREMLHASRFAGPATEDLVKELRDLALAAAMRRRVPLVISDDMNLDHETYAHLVAFGARGYRVAVQDFRDVDLSTCRMRNLQRERAVPDQVVQDLYREFIEGRA